MQGASGTQWQGDSLLDKAQQVLLGIGFSGFLALTFAERKLDLALFTQISSWTLVAPFVAIVLLVFLLTRRRLRLVMEQLLSAKHKNKTLNNNLRAASEKLNYDELTGLPNKRLLQDRFEEAVIRAKRDKSLVLLYRVSLADFTQIVAKHGNSVGLDLIRMVSERLESAVRSTDTVVRTGACNFVLIIESVDSVDGIAPVSRKIRGKLGNIFPVNGLEPLYAVEHISMAKYPWDGATLDDLMKAAENKPEAAQPGPNWVDAMSDKFSDMSQSSFAFLRESVIHFE